MSDGGRPAALLSPRGIGMRRSTAADSYADDFEEYDAEEFEEYESDDDAEREAKHEAKERLQIVQHVRGALQVQSFEPVPLLCT